MQRGLYTFTIYKEELTKFLALLYGVDDEM